MSQTKPTFKVGDWVYSDINQGNCQIVAVEWRAAWHHVPAHWEYWVPGHGSRDFWPAREGAEFIEFEKTGRDSYRRAS